VRISIIAALDEEGVIGTEGRLPWHLPEDLRHFRRLTVGKPVVMGRRTWDTLERPLPRRTNIVLTRDPAFSAEGCIVARSPTEAIEAARGAEELMIMGGSQIYSLFLPQADTFYLTRVHAHVGGDTLFPPWSPEEWAESDRVYHPADGRHEYCFSFITLHRRSSASSAEQ
jgi:dihydrofolate reductase